MNVVDDPLRLDGSVILVTGSNGQIGMALIEGLANAGAKVISTDIRGTAQYVPHDVTSETEWAALAHWLESEFGHLDAVVHNAGVVLVKNFTEMTITEFRQVQRVNVESIVMGTQALLPLLRIGGEKRRGGASIVNMSSVAGLRGAPMHAAYNASKGAVTLLTKSMANEFAQAGWPIRVNSVHPGSIEGPMMDTILAEYGSAHGLGPERMKELASQAHPVGRMGQASEIVGGVVLLCSPAGSFMTGSELVIDGGCTSR